jgi:hypothetical protein
MYNERTPTGFLSNKDINEDHWNCENGYDENYFLISLSKDDTTH